MKLRTNKNPVAKATFKALGADINSKVIEIEDLKENIEAGVVEAGEGIYSRIYPLEQNQVTESVLDTQHSLFLTSMIMRNDFYEKLSPEVQAVLKEAALKAGRKERETTIQDGEEAKEKLKAEGINIHELTLEEKAEFIEKTKVVYEEFKDKFTPGLIDKIKKS
jgi:TRAP-type C4-dicarboxylate transport system substrate-binding protein